MVSFLKLDIKSFRSEERKVRGSVVGDEDCTDDVSSGAGATSPAASPRPDDDSTQSSSGGHLWPSMQDLNTRLRRLITAYQRNYKREELKMQQRAKVSPDYINLRIVGNIDHPAVCVCSR
jgi:hypothetical protein